MKKKILLTLIQAILATMVMSQKTVLHTNMQWFQYNSQIRLNGKLTLSADAGIRRSDALHELALRHFRTGIGYPVAKGFQGLTGIGTFVSYSGNIRNRTEIRLYQDLTRSTEFRKIRLQHRLRMEARYFINRTGNSFTEPTNFNFRFRYRFYTQTGLIPLSANHPDRMLLFNLGDEIMVNAGSQIKYNRLDNNRLLIGSGIDWSPHLNISLNYVHQFGQRNRPDTYEESDILWLTINHRIGFASRKANPKIR